MSLKLRRRGARVVGQNKQGNYLVMLNQKSLLGDKGDLFQLPKDEVIFKAIVLDGHWAPEESRFLRKSIKENLSSSLAFVDIGANCGFISKQSLNDFGDEVTAFLVEPIQQHVEAITYNLHDFQNLQVFQFALGKTSSKIALYTDKDNRGATTFYENVVSDRNTLKTSVEIQSTHEFFSNHLSKFDTIVLKIDTEGMDALILSCIPSECFSRIESAVIEIFALPEIEASHVETVLTQLANFEFRSWNGFENQNLSIDVIRELWLKKDSSLSNLYIAKTKCR
jgi:FkbM family methyltransferase